MTTRVDRLIAELDSLAKDDLARKIREVVAAEREDELEAFLIHDDGVRREEVVDLDERALVAAIAARLRDEFDLHVDATLLAVACTRPADSVFDRPGYDLAFVPRPE